MDIAGPGRSFVTVSAPYEPFASEFGPLFSPSAPAGRFVHLSLETNRERFARDGARFPAQSVDRGVLRFGSLDPLTHEFDTRTDVAVGRGVVELRLAWSLLNVTDPSSGKVLHQETEHAAPFDVAETEGFRFYAFAVDPEAPESGVESQLPAAGASSPTWSWPRWNEPKFRLDLKLGAERLRRTLRAMPTFIGAPTVSPPAAAEKPDAR